MRKVRLPNPEPTYLELTKAEPLEPEPELEPVEPPLLPEELIARVCVALDMTRDELRKAIKLPPNYLEYKTKRYLYGPIPERIIAYVDTRIGQLIGVREELQRATDKATKRKMKKDLEKLK